MRNRDTVAELLSLVRHAYKTGFMLGNTSDRAPNSELLYAQAETLAADYVQAREENERHPLALLCETLKQVKP